MPYSDRGRQRLYQVQWMLARRNAYLEGKSCVWCDARANLLFHHVDPSRKESHRIWSWRKERIEAEIRKCIIICAPCHRSYHFTVNNPRRRFAGLEP